MASTSRRWQGVERIRNGYHLWALALLLCPLSYVCLLLLHYFAGTGMLATVLVMLFVLTFAVSTRDGRTEAKIWQGALMAVAAGFVVGSVAHSFEGVDLASSFLAGMGAAVPLGFFYLFYTWITAELAGVQIETGDLTGPPRHLHAPSQAALGFLWFLSLLLYGLGAAWSHGDSRTPDPTWWVVVQLLLTLGLMLLERLGFFERSAQEGNLSLAYRAHRTWVAGALLLLLVAITVAGLGPRRSAPSQPGRVAGNRMRDDEHRRRRRSRWSRRCDRRRGPSPPRRPPPAPPPRRKRLCCCFSCWRCWPCWSCGPFPAVVPPAGCWPWRAFSLPDSCVCGGVSWPSCAVWHKTSANAEGLRRLCRPGWATRFLTSSSTRT